MKTNSLEKMRTLVMHGHLYRACKFEHLNGNRHMIRFALYFLKCGNWAHYQDDGKIIYSETIFQ